VERDLLEGNEARQRNEIALGRAESAGRSNASLPSIDLVRFLAAVIRTTGGAARMRVRYRRVLPSVRRLRNGSLLRRHGLAIGRRAGVIGSGVDTLSKRQAGRSKKNAQHCASRKKTVHDLTP